VLSGVIAAALIYGGIVAFMYAYQGRLMYPGSGATETPEAVGLSGVEEVTIETTDGLRLLAWWMPPEPGRTVVLFWHGNAGTLATRVHKFKAFGGRGYGMLMMAYRGYSGNPGTPTQPVLVRDAVTATNWVRREAEGHPLIYYGESLGGAVAMQLATKVPPQAIVLEGTFDSAADLAQRRYPFLPAALLIRDRWDSMAIADDSPAPVLMLHGDADRTVPIEHARRLFQRLPEPKRFVRIEGAAHVDLFDHGAEQPTFEWLGEHGL